MTLDNIDISPIAICFTDGWRDYEIRLYTVKGGKVRIDMDSDRRSLWFLSKIGFIEFDKAWDYAELKHRIETLWENA